MSNELIEFNRLMARNKHLERMVTRYKQAEEWENLQKGDRVVIDNSDSLHDGKQGIFIAHEWFLSGYVQLFVEFPDGKHCNYLPTQVVKVYDKPIEPKPATTAEPLTVEDLAPVTVAPSKEELKIYADYRAKTYPNSKPEPEPPPEPKWGGIDFSLLTPEKVEAENERIIEAKLAQVAKMPESVRKKVLSSTLAAELVPQALEIAIKRGIIPPF